ncbi:MAG: phenylacetate--CoA ligase family protein [bacterium]|nr:phenylacetate--CoA ligase family protein [bacterium]
MIFDALKQLRVLQKNQYLPSAELKALQSRKLRQIVRHAYEHVSYYRQVFDSASIKPEQIHGLEHLDKLPILSKDTLKSLEPRDILTHGIRPKQCVVKDTSGSTGKPLQVFFNEAERDFQILLNLRIFLAARFTPIEKTAYLVKPERFPEKKHWFQHFGILRRDYCSVFDSQDMQIDFLRRSKPDILYGYASSLIMLAHRIQEQGIEDIRLKAVFSSAETLEQKSKAAIASAMNTQVYDILGMVEMGDIAWECPAQKGYHMNTDSVIIEFLDDRNQPVQSGQEGRLVCTSLYSYTMPLIRYEVGDICIPSKRICSCGRTLPLMERVQGRVNDFIVLSDGQLFPPGLITAIMAGFQEVLQYKVLQEQKESLLVQIVRGNEYCETTSQRVKKEFEEAVHHKLEIRVEPVQQIPRDTSGKIRTVVSNVSIPE